MRSESNDRGQGPRASTSSSAVRCPRQRLSFGTPHSELRTGFTLVELLVVVAIIAILAGLLMPAIGSALNKSHETAVSSLIHQCQIAAQKYFDDHGDYPPTTWREFFLTNPFRTTYVDVTVTPNVTRDVLDLNRDGVVDINDYNIFADPANTPNLSNYDEGNIVFTMCLASRNGGPYLQPSDWQIRQEPNSVLDTNGVDYAAWTGNPNPYPHNVVYNDINWYMNSDSLFALTDWWGNPLVYIQNRDYANTDGLDNNTPPNVINPQAFGSNGTDAAGFGGEYMPYVAHDQTTFLVTSRDASGFRTNNPPNLDSFQLYSLGSDGVANRALVETNPQDWDGNGQGPDHVVPPQWTLRQTHFLGNWEPAAQ